MPSAPSPTSLARVIGDRLPDRLRAQLSTATLRIKARALASAGWTEQALAVAVTDRGWNGAHAGAVLIWLSDLASVKPPCTEATHESRTITLRLRAEAARVDRGRSVAATAIQTY